MGEATMERADDRRRHSRLTLGARVTLTGADRTFQGVAQNMSYSGVLVKTDGEALECGAEYDVVIELPFGAVRARGEVVRTDPETSTFGLELNRVDSNGHLLLAMLIAPPARAGVA